MAKKTYAELLKSPMWQRKRLQILSRDRFTCKLCKDAETTLNVHHIEYSDGNPWDIDNSKLITVCEHCHTEIEHLKKYKYITNDQVFTDIKIYKSNNWSDGTRIMLTSINNNLFMRIYDGSGSFIDGFKFSDYEELKKIKDIIALTMRKM